MRGFSRISLSPPAVFTISFIALFFLLGLHKVLFLRPQSIHQWAQCDRASVAWNYYTGGYDFFHPRVNNIANGSGITGLEFPIIQYVVALLYGVFGFHEWIYRLLTLCVYACGLYSIWRTVEQLCGGRLIASLVLLFLGCSPLLAYYSVNFIPDLYSMSFLMISFYILIQYDDLGLRSYYLLHWLFVSLACLIKPTALIYLPAFYVYRIKSGKYPLNGKKSIGYLASSVLVTVLTFSWYAYAKWLSSVERSGVFLLQTRPVQDLSQLLEIGGMIRLYWLDRICDPGVLGLIGIAFLLLLIVRRKDLPVSAWLAICSLPGVVCYFWQMGQQFRYHDYYALLLFPALVFMLISILNTRLQTQNKLVRSIVLLFAVSIISFQFYSAKTHVRVSHKSGSWKYGHVFFDDYFQGDGILTRAGLSGQEAILSAFDSTSNVSLYLLGRKGISVPGHAELESLLKNPQDIEISYLLVHENSLNGINPFDTSIYPLSEVRNEPPFRLYRIRKI